MVKNPPANTEYMRDKGSILGQEGLLEKEMATYSTILAWEIPRTEETEGLQSMGSKRVRDDSATKQQQQHVTFRNI